MQADDKDDEATTATISIPISVELTEEDIPGTALDEPLEAKNNAALRWWLQCHGIEAPSSSNKKQLVAIVT